MSLREDELTQEDWDYLFTPVAVLEQDEEQMSPYVADCPIPSCRAPHKSRAHEKAHALTHFHESRQPSWYEELDDHDLD